MEFPKKPNVHISDQDHLSIWCGFRLDPVGWEGEIAGGEDHGLGELNIHIMHIG